MFLILLMHGQARREVKSLF